MARSSRAKRTRSTFRKTNGTNPWAGHIGNNCKCKDCRSSQTNFLGVR